MQETQDIEVVVDDGSHNNQRSARARARVDAANVHLVINYETRSGRGASMYLPLTVVSKFAATLPPSSPPLTIVGHMACIAYNAQCGPYTLADTANAIVKGRDVEGSDGIVQTHQYVTWRDEQGVLWGRQVVGDPVRLLESKPDDAELEVILGKLSTKERTLLESRLGRR